MSTLSTVEVLRGAKAVLERNGWFQGEYYDHMQGAELHIRSSACRVCLLGALHLGSGSSSPLPTSRAWNAVHVVESVLAERGFDDFLNEWNDAEGRTLAEVYALLDEAIERAEAGEVR